MSSALSWVLVASGITVTAIGLRDPGTAWLAQREAAKMPAHPTKEFAMPPGFVAKISIPRLEESVYVVPGTSREDLRRGPGYLAGSSSPGLDGNCIIAGHRDLHFRMLKDVRVGDAIEIQSEQGKYTYRVSSIEVVSSTNVQALRRTFPRQLTLVTCYPFYYLGRAPKRFIVKASLQ